MRGDVHDDVLGAHAISVTEVRMSPDLRHATVFIKPLLGADEDEVLTALKRHVRYLRGEVSKRVKTKFAASLKFRIDESFDEGSYIRSEEHTSELQSLMRISSAVFCLKKKK